MHFCSMYRHSKDISLSKAVRIITITTAMGYVIQLHVIRITNLNDKDINSHIKRGLFMHRVVQPYNKYHDQLL